MSAFDANSEQPASHLGLARFRRLVELSDVDRSLVIPIGAKYSREKTQCGNHADDCQKARDQGNRACFW